MIDLYPHQQQVLDDTRSFGHVAYAWIDGYEGLYSISSKGNIYSWHSGHSILLKPTNHNGKEPYYYVSLCKNGKVKKQLVHRLVAMTFIPNPDKKLQVNHIDGNVHNNHINNLEWVTNAENTKHAYVHRLRSKKVIWINDGKHIMSLRSMCISLGLNYKKIYARYKYSNWDINKCLEIGGDKNHVRVISASEASTK